MPIYDILNRQLVTIFEQGFTLKKKGKEKIALYSLGVLYSVWRVAETTLCSLAEPVFVYCGRRREGIQLVYSLTAHLSAVPFCCCVGNTKLRNQIKYP